MLPWSWPWLLKAHFWSLNLLVGPSRKFFRTKNLKRWLKTSSSFQKTPKTALASERMRCFCDTVCHLHSFPVPQHLTIFRSPESPRRRRNNFRKWISKLLLWIGRKRGRRTQRRHNKMQFLKIQFSLNKYLDSMVNSNLGTSHSRVATDEWFLCESRHEKFIFHSAVRINFQFCTKINRLEPFDCQLSVSGDVFRRLEERGRWTRNTKCYSLHSR